MSATIPGFSRIEIRTDGKRDIANAAYELRQLADELDRLAGLGHCDETLTILAHHKIKATSQMLRGK
ncbi:MAG: hypothetical protein E5X15_09950 [Mesorhizobium sp.]|uniref:hypothetical protein n=1 Tax=Mesorhizobium sp. TaxID=1871066 RepID=UPI000FE617D8|nr:hypothetical protein [Mesorhizobium sp.]RWF74518.1 MAG: hypothetical protein EOQ34_05160 [Mesorhizobium sp.]TIN81871.1 MAG: hypothetical protein E5X97_31870 [Mesorhizobium sp.]TIR78954.1 MAG: hypothetical protein E5X15_09950 [Mesorhizobium sp.]